MCPEKFTGDTCELPCPAVYIDEKAQKKYCLVGTDYFLDSLLKSQARLNTFCEVQRNNVVEDSGFLCGRKELELSPIIKAHADWVPYFQDKFNLPDWPSGDGKDVWQDDDCGKFFGNGFQELDCTKFPKGFWDLGKLSVKL